MTSSIRCDVVSAEREIYSGAVEMLIAPAVMGEIGVTPGHAPLLTQLVPGPVRLIFKGGREDIFYVSGGMMEVQPKVVTILADTALRANDLDEAEAKKARKKAEEMMMNQKGEVDYSVAASHLAEAVAQIRTLQQIRKRLNR